MTNTLQVDWLLAENAKLRAEIAKLRAAHGHGQQPDASTATPNQTYTRKPGDPWSQYTGEMDGMEYVYTPGYPQEGSDA